MYVKENIEVERNDGKGYIKLNASKQLSHFFNSYAQTINKTYDRTGSLFESPFERKLITNDQYLTSVIYYCHRNAQTHGFVNDFKDWHYSSYNNILENKNNNACTDKTIAWFGGKEAFIKAHQGRYTQPAEGTDLYGV